MTARLAHRHGEGGARRRAHRPVRALLLALRPHRLPPLVYF
jgi:hypothetical protein